jgi:type I restriction enzyme S subunit
MAPNSGSVNPSRFPDEAFHLYSIPAFDNGRPDLSLGREIGSSKQVVRPNDVLLSRIVPHIRRAWVVGEQRGYRQIASGEWIVFRSAKMHPSYLLYLVVEDRFHAKFMNTVAGVGGSLLRARPAQVADIEVLLPSLSEQRRIAERLEQADQLCRTRRYALERTETFLPAAFLELFGDPTTNPLGIPVAELGDFLSFVTSGSRGWADYYVAKGARFIRSLDVRMNNISDEDAVFVKPPNGAESDRTRVKPGDVLLTITGSRIGRVAPVPERLNGAFISQHVAILRLKAGLLPEFLSMFLSLDTGGQRQIGRLQYGQTKPGLNLDQIREMLVPVPHVSDQQRFLELAKRVEYLRAVQREALRQAEHLFTSLLHRAFTIDRAPNVHDSVSHHFASGPRS